MILYTGWGILAYLVFMIVLIAHLALENQVPFWGIHLYAAAGALSWALGKRLNQVSASDTPGGKPRHTVYGVRMEYWGPLFFLLFSGISVAMHIQSAEKPPQAQAPVIHRLNVVDEDAESARQPVATALALDFMDDSAVEQLATVVKSRLRHRQFEDLDAYAGELRNTDARMPGGGSLLHLFYNRIDEPSAGPDVTDAEWQSHLQLYEDWIAKYPQSVTARAGYADTLVVYAWHARGDGWARDVSGEQWKLFGERLQTAQHVVDEARSLSERCPHLYDVQLSIALGQNWNDQDYDRLFEEAIAFAPRYRAFYSHKATRLLPRWGGEEGQWQKFAEKSANRLGGPEGEDLYYYLYSAMVSNYEIGEVAAMVKPVWPRLRKGFEASESLYGVNPDLLNKFGKMAYYAGDQEAVQTTINRIGSHWNQEIWGELHPAQVQAWATSTSTPFRPLGPRT